MAYPISSISIGGWSESKMVDFPNVQGIHGISSINPVQRAESARAVSGKATPQTVVTQPASADIVQISADAVMKGRLSAFATALLNEMNATNPERLAKLKLAYAGDRCPVSAYNIAGAIIGRIKQD